MGRLGHTHEHWEEIQDAPISPPWRFVRPGLYSHAKSILSPAALILLVFVASITAALLSYTVDRSIDLLHGSQQALIRHVHGPWSSFLFMAGIDVIFACVARIVVHFAPTAIGSGIPEMKCILSGHWLDGFLSLRVLLAKGVGLVFAIASGMPLGKEGPFVHIAACVSATLLKLRFWDQLSRDDRDMVLLSSVAVGVGATFSAPIGGVLFAIELMMPRLYDVSSYRICHLASTAGSLCFLSVKMLFDNSGITPLVSSDVKPEEANDVLGELVFIGICTGTGVVCGVLAGCFVRSHKVLSKLVKFLRGLSEPPPPISSAGAEPLFVRSTARTVRGPSLGRDLLLLAFFAVACASLRVMDPRYFGKAPAPLINDLFSEHADTFADQGIFWLGVVLVIKWLQIAASLCLPVPSGCVAPAICLGAMVGRLIALTLPLSARQFLSPNDDFSAYAARLAIVGGTTFAASVCGSISIVVTVFELIAVPRLILPLACATLAALSCAGYIAPSLYDSVLIMRNVPALPTLQATRRAMKTVKSELRPELMSLALPRHALRSDLERISNALAIEGTKPLQLPIFEEVVRGSRVLCGAVEARVLPSLIQSVGALEQTTFVDILPIVFSNSMYRYPFVISSKITLKDAYLQAQAKNHEKTFMVVDEGQLVGILSRADLLKFGY